MNNLSDFEDDGAEVKEIIVGTLYPDFKARSTMQLWEIGADAIIAKWEGTTLVEDSVHELKIVNTVATEVVITFGSMYNLIDETGVSIKIGPNGVAHMYGVGAWVADGVFALALRVGSQDKRNLSN